MHMNINCFREKEDSINFVEHLKRRHIRFIYMIKTTKSFGRYYVVYCITNNWNIV